MCLRYKVILSSAVCLLIAYSMPPLRGARSFNPLVLVAKSTAGESLNYRGDEAYHYGDKEIAHAPEEGCSDDCNHDHDHHHDEKPFSASEWREGLLAKAKHFDIKKVAKKGLIQARSSSKNDKGEWIIKWRDGFSLNIGDGTDIKNIAELKDAQISTIDSEGYPSLTNVSLGDRRFDFLLLGEHLRAIRPELREENASGYMILAASVNPSDQETALVAAHFVADRLGKIKDADDILRKSIDENVKLGKPHPKLLFELANLKASYCGEYKAASRLAYIAQRQEESLLAKRQIQRSLLNYLSFCTDYPLPRNSIYPPISEPLSDYDKKLAEDRFQSVYNELKKAKDPYIERTHITERVKKIKSINQNTSS